MSYPVFRLTDENTTETDLQIALDDMLDADEAIATWQKRKDDAQRRVNAAMADLAAQGIDAEDVRKRLMLYHWQCRQEVQA